MLDSKILDDIAKKLNSVIPEGLKHLESDLQKKFKEVLQATFNKLDLVTREEFDAQVKVLARTRQKLEKLEKQLAQFEGKTSKQTRTRK